MIDNQLREQCKSRFYLTLRFPDLPENMLVTDLPSEMLEKIVGFLPKQDMYATSCVSTSFRQSSHFQMQNILSSIPPLLSTFKVCHNCCKTDRQTDIGAYRGNICNKKCSPRVNCFQHLSLSKTGGQTLWLMEGLYAIEKDVLRFIGL